MTIKVKPLVWEGDGFWSHGPDEGWMEEACTSFGWGYSIEFGRHDDGNFIADSAFGERLTGFDTPDAAKAAAQADYEARILSAIEAGDPATIRAEELRDMIAAKAREYAEHYPQSSDGRNTFLMFAEWVESLALIDKEQDR